MSWVPSSYGKKNKREKKNEKKELVRKDMEVDNRVKEDIHEEDVIIEEIAREPIKTKSQLIQLYIWSNNELLQLKECIFTMRLLLCPTKFPNQDINHNPFMSTIQLNHKGIKPTRFIFIQIDLYDNL